MTRPTLLLPALLALAACGPNRAPQIKIRDGWARATAPGQSTGAAYLMIENNGGSADRLVEVKTSRASMAMLHANDSSGGVARMRVMDGIDLPAGGRVELRPGGSHVMLEGLSAPLAAGDRFDLQLHFARAGHRTMSVMVVAPGSR